MGVEIERKFLVTGEAWRSLAQPRRLLQGYIATGEKCTVRVRIDGDQAWLTLKGKTDGISRSEWEYALPVGEAEQMLAQLSVTPFVEKLRYRIENLGHVWEVDEFLGENAGLVVAEIELSTVDEVFERPAWLGQEVSGDPRYYNSALAKHPFRRW